MTSTNTMMEELHKKERDALKKPLFKIMGSENLDRDFHHDECKTADSYSDSTVNSLPLALLGGEEESRRRRGIMKHRTHRDSLLATSTSKHNEINNRRPRRKVVFSEVEIREHAIIIGDNPGCFAGPPLSIDWPCEKKRTFDFETYEANRPPRRARLAMQMRKEIRIKLFRSLGYSSKDIVRLTRPVNIARQQRQNTIDTLQTHVLHESAEKIARGLKNALTLGRRKRQERKFLEPFCRTASQANLTVDCSSSSQDDGDDDDDDVYDDDNDANNAPDWRSKEEESTLDETLDVSSVPSTEF